MLTDILKEWGYEIHIDEEAGNLSGRDKQVPAVKDCRFTQTSFGTVVHDRSGKWIGQYETEDAAVEMIREMESGTGGNNNGI